MEAYNAKLLDGKRRAFQTQLLLGAEEILARLHHEHQKSKVYTPLGLGEILSRRTFAADGTTNPLAQQPAQNAAHGVQALRLDKGELVAASEKEWIPRSLMAIIDAAMAANGRGSS